VRDPQPAALVEVDLESAVVRGLVMRRAHRGEAARRVIAASAARHDVVDVDEPRVLAAGDAAAPAVAPQHGAPDPRRDGLGRPRRRVAVDAAQELGVARRSRQLGGAELDALAGGVDPGARAVGAAGDGDLVRRLPRRRIGGGGAGEAGGAQRVEHLAVGQRVPARGLEARPRGDVRAEHGPGQEEASLVQPRGRIGWRVGWIAAPAPGDHVLDVAHAGARGGGEPGVLVGGGRDPRQLARGAVDDVAGGHRGAQLG
jgi:hypothetical protein